MFTRPLAFCALFLLLVLTACGESAGGSVAATKALVAPTATPNLIATQTRVAELSQIATLTAPTAVAALATPATKPAGNSELAKGNLVGRTSNADTFVGMVVNGDEVMAYVCDGKNMSQWFTGKVQGDQISLSAENGAKMTASVKKSTTTSEVQATTGTFLDSTGQSLSFTSNATDNLGKAGLYRASGTSGESKMTMGVIVLPDGNLRGVLQVGQEKIPVTNPTFATNSLTATFPNIGPLVAQKAGS